MREWILRWARLKAVISLPQETFSPYGAGVKASIIFLEKRSLPITIEGQLELGQAIAEVDQDYQVYMARVENIGYDATGRLFLSEEEAHNPPEIQETIIDFSNRLSWHC